MTLADLRDALETLRQANGPATVMSLSWDGDALSAVMRPKDQQAKLQAKFDPSDFAKSIEDLAPELAGFFRSAG